MAGRFRRRAADGNTRDRAEPHWPAARVRTLKEVLAEPHVQQREVLQFVNDSATGFAIGVPSIGFKWNQHSLGPETRAPRLGQHTEQKLTALGIDVAEILSLRASGVI